MHKFIFGPRWEAYDAPPYLLIGWEISPPDYPLRRLRFLDIIPRSISISSRIGTFSAGSHEYTYRNLSFRGNAALD